MKSSAVEMGMSGAEEALFQALFEALVQRVNELNNGIAADAGAWAHFTSVGNASGGRVARYASQCRLLRTDGEDGASWSTVKNAAAAALGQAERFALITVFDGFLAITSPSRNSGSWAALRALSYASLDALDPASFRVLMRRARQLNEAIDDDALAWGRYAGICADALHSGVRTYIERCSTELPMTGPDQDSWRSVVGAARRAAPCSHPDDALRMIMLGFLDITRPARNGWQWAALRQLALAQLDCGGSIPFAGADTRARRELHALAQLPAAISATHLVRRAGFPARHADMLGHWPRSRVESCMRLDLAGPEGCAYFLVTHSQDGGGYIGLAKVDAAHLGQGARDHVIASPDRGFAGAFVWWERLGAAHPGGCNRPANGGQIGSVAVIAGHDWTRLIPIYGHVMTPVGKGSKVLFYDFSSLSGAGLPSGAYMGSLSAAQLNLRPRDDGEIASVNIEQGPDGRFYLIAGNAGQSVLWTSATLVPDIAHWTQVQISSAGRLGEGNAMLAWISLDKITRSLCYVQPGPGGMHFRPLRYMVVEGQVVGVDVADGALYCAPQADQGRFCAGAGKGVALHAACDSINAAKGPPGLEQPCLQIRAWYS